MKYFYYLKSSFIVYITTGVIFGAAVFLLMTVHNYKNSLVSSLNTMDRVSTNKETIRAQTDKMTALLKYIKEDLKMETADNYPERLFYKTLDDMKTYIKDARVTVDKFEETDGEIGLPVEISAPVKNYEMIADYVGYVESMRIPGYMIRHLSIVTDPSGNVVLTLQGRLRTPANSITGNTQ